MGTSTCASNIFQRVFQVSRLLRSLSGEPLQFLCPALKTPGLLPSSAARGLLNVDVVWSSLLNCRVLVLGGSRGQAERMCPQESHFE